MTCRCPDRPLLHSLPAAPVRRLSASRKPRQAPPGACISRHARRPASWALTLLCIFLELTGCVPAPVKLPVVAPPPSRTLAGAVHYQVVGNGTLVYVRVLRGGSLARLGHNHVVELPDVHGDIYLASDLGNSLFDLAVAPAKAVVDPPALRKAQGSGFDTWVSEDARAGTRRNMLGPNVLGAAKFPYVVIRSSRIEGSLPNPKVTVDLTLKGVTRTMTIPISVHISGSRLVAKGRFGLLQSAFGIEPYSVLGGALKVKDKVEVVFDIEAEKVKGRTA